jgi:hypothetical protein
VRVCGRWIPGISGSNPAGGIDVCVVCCTVQAKPKPGKSRQRNKYGKSTNREQEKDLKKSP